MTAESGVGLKTVIGCTIGKGLAALLYGLDTAATIETSESNFHGLQADHARRNPQTNHAGKIMQPLLSPGGCCASVPGRARGAKQVIHRANESRRISKSI